MGGGQGRCERRSQVFVKIQKKWGRGSGSGWGGQDGCERRIENFVKIKKKNERGGGRVGGGGRRVGGGGGGGVRVDANREVKFL